MRKTAVIIMVLTALACTVAFATDYASLQLKASRFFEQREWASAQAMYDLMLDRRPETADIYGYAIVTAAMRSDSVAELGLLRKSLENHVPFDSTFEAVKRVSFELGKTDLYEGFLLMSRANHPWMGRAIDSYLMKYYTFRRDPEMMVKYSRIMLDGMPDDINFLTTLAQGYAQMGDYANAMETYHRILRLAPDNYNALLEVGNYNYMKWEQGSEESTRQAAYQALSRADSITPTPYVETMLTKLKNQTSENQTRK